MKKCRLIIPFICIVAIFSAAASVQAQITPMSDTELASITGQAGFAAMGSYMALQRSHGTGPNALSGFTYSDLSFQSERTGTMSEIRISEDGKSYSFDIHNPGVTIRDFHTRIHAGSQPLPENSLGSLSISHIQVVTHGILRITVR
ncbi:MAG: hypothetical protein MI742_00305 [Desulfobacterales bacterium]|nr:hypothetical protein [Desulfobacterales bacterium]